MTTIDNSIRATLAFFHLFGRPLTEAEIGRWAWDAEKFTPEQLQRGLKIMKDVREEDGYWYLQKGTYPDRQEQKKVNAALRSKVFRYLPMLRMVPGLRFCGVGNTLAFDAADEESDIDLFIIARRDMLWFVRLATTIILHMQGVRRHGNKVARRFCLSFFIDEAAMDLSRVAIEDDVYLRYWIATLLPIFGQETWERFQEANSAFVGEHLIHAFPGAPTGPEGGNAMVENFLLSVGRPILTFVRWLQRSKMRHLPVQLGPGACVVVNDHMLKFHNNDRREKFRDEWRASLQKAA